MKITRIYFRRWRRFPLIAVGAALGICLTMIGGFFVGSSVEAEAVVISAEDKKNLSIEQAEFLAEIEKIKLLKIHSYSNFPGQGVKYSFKDKDGVITERLDYVLMGYHIQPVDSNSCVFRKRGEDVPIKR